MNRLLYKLLFRGTKHLLKFEMACLQEFMRAHPTWREVIEEQIRSIDLIHRNTRGKIVVFKRFSAMPEIRRFPNKDIELLAATMTVSNQNFRSRADLIVEDGLISGFKFGLPPQFGRSEEADVSSYQTVTDVTVPAPEYIKASGPVVLHRLQEVSEIAYALPPGTPKAIRAFTDRWRGQFPHDLIDLLNETDGFKFTHGSFRGVNSRVIAWPNENLQVLIEDQSCELALCIREFDSTLTIYLLDQLVSELEPVGEEFLKSFRLFVNRASPLDQRTAGS